MRFWCYRHSALLIFCLLFFVAFATAVEDTGPVCNEPTSPDGTCCWHRFNLQEENRVQLAPPTVVDITEANGNLLIRGPMPLIIRSGKGNDPVVSPCMNHADWRFAYDELNTMIKNEKNFAPVYFSPGKKAALAADLETFNLDDYEVTVISLLDHGDINPSYFASEQQAFGGNYSSCSDMVTGGTINGQTGYLIWSTVGFCDGGNNDQCGILLNTDTGTSCSYANLIDKIAAMMAEKSASGKKRLIYYHCVLGTDRTGGVTIGYLQKTIPSMSFAHAVIYAAHLGTETSIPPWPPNKGSQNLANAFCLKIGGNCNTTEPTRVYLPGNDQHSHLPGQEDAPVVTPSPTIEPATPIVPAQTPVPGRYDPTKSGSVNY